MEYILSLDIGTSSVKAGIIDGRGELCAFQRVAITALVNSSLHQHEVVVEAWLKAIREAVSAIKKTHPHFSAVAICGNGPTLVPCKQNGEPTHNAITWLDGRAQSLQGEIDAQLGKKIHAGFLLGKVLWLKKHDAQIYASTDHFLFCPEYICYLLTGVAVSLVPQGYAEYYGTESDIRALGLDEKKFAAHAEPGILLGNTTASAQEKFAIDAGLPVVAVGPDYIASLVGTGASSEGQACLRTGSSDGLNLCTKKTINDARFFCMPHFVRPYNNISGNISTTGKALDWYRALAMPEANIEEFFASAARVSCGADKLIFLPYLAGERSPHWDSKARASFIGLGLSHTSAHCARAVLEASGFALRELITELEAQELEFKELHITGRPSHAPLWNQIRADITGKSIVLPACPEPDLLGCAIIALTAIGHYSNITAASKSLWIRGRSFEPQLESQKIYSDLFGIYKASYQSLKNIFAQLSAL